jgi:hypothetical protein
MRISPTEIKPDSKVKLSEPIMNQLKSFDTLTLYVNNLHINIILKSMLRSPSKVKSKAVPLHAIEAHEGEEV